MSNKEWCPIARATDILGDRWSLLILRELSSGPKRFRTLKENIRPISMDQLTRKLEHLCAHFIIVKQEFSECPPRVEYALTDLGKSFVPVLRRLLGWSLEKLWSAPLAGEEVDIASILRTIVTFWGCSDGVVAVCIRKSKEIASYTVKRFEDGRVMVEAGDILLRLPTVELSIRDFIQLATQNKSSAEVLVTGNFDLIKKMIPIFEGVKVRSRNQVGKEIFFNNELDPSFF